MSERTQPLVDLAERPRASNWSMRAALTRYSQPQPQRASDVIELLRRIEAALAGGRAVDDLAGPMAALDGLGDTLATWAVERAGERPDQLVDTVTTQVAAALDDLGVAREDRTRPPRMRGPRRG